MKNSFQFSVFSVALFVACSALGAPTAKQVAAYDANKRAQLIEWIEQLRGLAGDADKKAAAAQADLAISQAELAAAVTNVTILQGDINRLDEWGKAQWTRAEKAQATLDAVLPKYHKLKNYVGTALAFGAGLLVGICIFRWCAPALNTVPGMILAFGVPVGVAGAVFTFIQLRL